MTSNFKFTLLFLIIRSLAELLYSVLRAFSIFYISSDSKNRVAADYSAFVRDWETSQQARNHPSPAERKWVVFAICMYKCIACHY